MKKVSALLVVLCLLVPLASFAQPEWEVPAPQKFDPPITVTTIKSEVGNTFAFGGENVDYENNVWTQSLLDRYGIIVKYLWIVDSSQYTTKYNLMLASGDIPDIMSVNISDQNKLMYDGVLEDLTDVYANAPERVKTYSNAYDAIAFNSVSQDGKLYALPYVPMGGEALQSVYIRSDWMEKLNLPAPKTMQDLIAIAEAFVTQDPDGNGQSDTIGMPVREDIYNSFDQSAFYNAYHAYPDYYFEGEDGTLKFGTIQPEMKNALKALQDMYTKGIVSAEFGTHGYNEQAKLIAAGKQGIQFGPYWMPLIQLQSSLSNDPNASWACYPVPSIDDSPCVVQSNISAPNYVVVRKGYAYPQAAAIMMDMYAEYFLEAVSDEVYDRFVNDAAGNEIWLACWPEVRMDYTGRSVNIHKQIVSVLGGEMNREDMLAEARGVLGRMESYLNGGDPLMWCWDKIYNVEGPLYWQSYKVDRGEVFYNKKICAPTETELDRSATLSKILKEAAIKIIKGEDIDSFDGAVDEWMRAGGQDMLSEINEWYAGVK